MRNIITALIFGLCYIHSNGQALTDIEKRPRLIDTRVELKHDTTGFSALQNLNTLTTTTSIPAYARQDKNVECPTPNVQCPGLSK